MIVIVAGMHRSGTSALAGLLHANDISMGVGKDFYPPPMRENPKGFYENVRFRRQNDKMLAANHYRVKSWTPWPLHAVGVGPKQLAEIAELFENYYTAYDNWGWKDPRTSLTMAVWLKLIDSYGLRDETRILQCYRSLDAVAVSMRSRGNKEKYPGQFMSVAHTYHVRLRQHVRYAGFSEQLMKVDFADLIHNTAETVDDLSAHIGLALNDISHIDPTLERTTGYACKKSAEGNTVSSSR